MPTTAAEPCRRQPVPRQFDATSNKESSTGQPPSREGTCWLISRLLVSAFLATSEVAFAFILCLSVFQAM